MIKVGRTRVYENRFHFRLPDIWRMQNVRGYKLSTKVTISENDAKAIIENMSLKGRHALFKGSMTYRLTWFHVDYLENKF